MEVCGERDIYPEQTKNGLSYCFTPKHHGPRSKTVARWLPMPRSEEFEVFNLADTYQLQDENGNLYGLRISTNAAGHEDP